MFTVHQMDEGRPVDMMDCTGHVRPIGPSVKLGCSGFDNEYLQELPYLTQYLDSCCIHC